MAMSDPRSSGGGARKSTPPIVGSTLPLDHRGAQGDSLPVAATSRSLMRLGGRLRGVAPLASRFIDSAVGGVDDWMTRKLGEEFNERLARVPLNLTATGIEEFGLDPHWTKYALASVAFLHR